MKSIEEKFVRFRVLLIAVLFSLFFAVIGLKAAHLQIYQGPWLSRLAADQVERSEKTSGKRGTIYDRNLSEMAVSIQVTSIAAYPNQIENHNRAAAALSKTLKVEGRSLLKKIHSDRSFVWVKRQATPREVESVKTLGIKGIGFVPEYNRFYPAKTLAAQVIGFTGIDGEGLEGIEFYYDRYLRGKEGFSTVLQDALGNQIVADDSHLRDFSGSNLVLTIDRQIQFITEKTLADTVSKFSARSGIAIVMEIETGAVLAMAHYPFFNPNDFNHFNKDQWRNRAITDPFEPGSTMKIFSAAAAIDSGGSSPNTIFFCENGAYRIGSKTVTDPGGFGWLSLQQIIKYSSNIGAIKISEMVGPERLYNTLSAFGFGTRTGIDCPGETSGNLYPFEGWTPMDTGAISFGHGVAASPIQLITAVSAIANNGVLMRPYLVASITDPQNRTLHSFKPQMERRAVSEKTARTIANIMKTVINKGGTGTLAAMDGYTACGKTGTAQKIDADGTYAKDRYVASFLGFAPSSRPVVSVLVIIDEPQGQYYGGLVAAPAFRNIAQETLNYLNVPPDGRQHQLAVSTGRGSRS